MEAQHDTVGGRAADDQHDPDCGERCDSTFDRWRCDLPVAHDGPHRSGDGSQRAEWNSRAAGRGLRDLARPAAHVERAARAAELS